LKAFVLGAGLGTRLRPLTSIYPKPLLPIFGKPLITFAFDHLREFGIRELIVNTHHLAGKFTDLFGTGRYRDASVQLVFEPVRLETGGGMKNVERQIGDDVFLVYSGDILTDIPIAELVADHFAKQNDVTIALRTTTLGNAVSWSPEAGLVTDILGKLSSGHPGRYDFAGISVWNPSIFARLPANETVSFVPLLVDWIRAGGKIGGTLLESNQWYNIGSRKEYLEVHQTIGLGKWAPDYVDREGWPIFVDASAQMNEASRVDQSSYVGPRCRIGPSAVIENSILIGGSTLPAGTELYSCIAAGDFIPPGKHVNKDFA
jgi:mannose-1-phosphate guanylyltransferase